MEDFTLNISLPRDEDGYVGRECPNCKTYFKVKFGTGLKTEICNCPYCCYMDDYNNFTTQSQNKYIESIIDREINEHIINPMLNKLDNSLKELERATRGGFLQIEVYSSSNNRYIPINYYQEKKLETDIVCNNCGLEFSIYGVFTTCPDCKELSALTIFKKSLESVKKRIELSNDLQDNEMKKMLLEDSLSGCISSFDGLGKALKKKYNTKLSNTKNLFQKINILSKELNLYGIDISKIIGNNNYDFIFEMFQARHLFEHNFGEIDDDFIKYFPQYKSQLKHKYLLEDKKILNLAELLQILGEKICEKLK